MSLHPYDKGLLKLGVLCFVLAAVFFGLAVSDAHCQERSETRFKLTGAVMAGLGAVDVIQTSTAIRSGQFREGNPAMRSVASNPFALGAVKAGTLAGIWTVAHQLRDRGHRRLSWVVLGIGVGSQAVIVGMNAKTLAQGKR